MTADQYQELGELMRREFGLVRGEIGGLRGEIGGLDTRLARVEVLQENQRDQLEVLADGLTSFREEVGRNFMQLRQESAAARKLIHTAVRYQATRTAALEERVTRLEERDAKGRHETPEELDAARALGLPERTQIVGPVTGWRHWRLRGGLLQSPVAGILWEGPVMTTRRDSEGKPLPVSARRLHPEPLTDHGVHSCKTPRVFADDLIWREFFHVLGQVDSYGHIIEYESGWRAQHAIARELWVSRRWGWDPNVIPILGARYDCPVHFLDPRDVRAWADRCMEGKDQ